MKDEEDSYEEEEDEFERSFARSKRSLSDYWARWGKTMHGVFGQPPIKPTDEERLVELRHALGQAKTEEDMDKLLDEMLALQEQESTDD